MCATTGYAVKWRFDGHARFMLWLEGESRDYFFKFPGSTNLMIAGTRSNLRRAAKKNGLLVSRQWAHTVDMNLVLSCLKGLSAYEKTPKKTSVLLLQTWNALDDLAYSVSDRKFASRSRAKKWNALYQKLFWANELPAVTPAKKHFSAVFRKSELAYLRDLLGTGGCKLLETAGVFDRTAYALGTNAR